MEERRRIWVWVRETLSDVEDVTEEEGSGRGMKEAKIEVN